MYPTRLQQQLEQGIKSRQCKVCGWRLFLDWITFNPVSYASVLCHPSPLAAATTDPFDVLLVVWRWWPPRLEPIIFIPLWQGPKLEWIPTRPSQKNWSTLCFFGCCSLNGPFYNRKVTKIGSLDKWGCSFLNESLGFLNTLLREIPRSTLSMKKWVFNIILFSLQPP